MEDLQKKMPVTTTGKDIRAIRDYEKLTRKQFFELTGIPETAQKNYERGITKKIGIDTVMKITKHPRFKKYTLWLMTGELSAASEQIIPGSVLGEKNDDQ